ncbi:unnamed protein product [Brassica napus]|uniref:(rape) hypothetical protein n=1 Tax=Brassica napus TaxID=3708 RepID=A0A816VFV9_BRANA|nr:unnamed protein product [Brassica napus]
MGLFIMAHSKVLPLLLLSCLFFLQNTHQLQNSQTQVLYQLRKHLEFPKALESWGSYYGDLCQIPPTPHMSISCEGNSVTELKVMGDKLSKPAGSMFHGSSLPNHTLSKAFLIDSFATTLTRLTSLKALTLVSLGIFGELPGKIHRLCWLESLDLSSNYLFGSLPPDVSRLVRLRSLALDGNYLNGSVPDALNSLSNLTVLALSHNEMSGELPDLSKLDHLHMLDLRENRFDSELPLLPKSLVTVLLSKNSFSGEVSRCFDGLSQLQHLDLSFNQLTGAPSRFLFSLANISYLDLASNKLSGKLPVDLTCGGKLGFVDLSNNRLVGTIPSCLGGSSGERVVKLGGNCLSIDGVHDQHQELLCEEGESRGRELQGRKIGTLVAVVSGAVLVLVLVAFGLLMLCTKRCSCCSCCGSKEKSVQQTRLKAVTDNNTQTSLSSQVLASARLISQTAKLSAQGVPSCRSFSFEELKEATDDFDSSRFLGEGSLGKLYRGTLENGSSVAIRCMVLSKKFSSQSIRSHLDCLSKLNHPHLLSFLGHCTRTNLEYDPTATILYLVYEYMPKGTYRAHLSVSCPEKILTWPDRLGILIEIAKAVHFLHTGVIPGSFNNQLKTNNILLDQHKIAKLSDYGVSAILEENEKLEIKSEGHKSKYDVAKREDDVYNFGFILLESLIGPLPTTKGEDFLLNEMTSFGSQDGRQKIVNPTVLTTSSQESLAIAISIANKCVLLEPSARPSFEDVLWNLQYAAQMQSAADAERKSDTSSASMSGNNNNPQGSAPSPFRSPGMMPSASVPGGFAQSHIATNFQAPFQFTQAQAMAQAQSKVHAQMQAGMGINQAQAPQEIGGLGQSSSPSMTTPGSSSNVKRLMRPPSGFPNNTVSPMRTMELTPAARKKKQKLPEKSLQERVAAILPESELYTQLLEFESRVDAALSRKKVDIQEALKNPPCVQKTLRIYVFNTFANQNNNPNADPPTWTLKIVGRILEDGVDPDTTNPLHPKFSSFFKKVQVSLDQRLYPENPLITWENSRSPAPQEGFEIKRKGNQEFAATIRLEMNYVPEKFKLSTALMDVLGIEVETRPRIIAAIWHYVKARKLQSPNDPSFFNCDAALQKVFGEQKLKFTMVSQKLSHHLSPPPPIHLEHKIKLSGSSPAVSACYDVLVDVPVTIQRDLSNLLANAEKNKEIEACDEAICAAIRKIHEHRRRRAFFLGFSQSPAEFVNALMESQSKDLKVVAGEASRNAERERGSDFFNQPWVEDAVIRYLNRRPARGN